jgi:hypothetical protein
MVAHILSTSLLVGWWLLICALLLICGVFLQKSFNQLRLAHTDKWKALGEPHVLGDRRAYYPARKFVWSQECRELDDSVLTRLARLSYYSGMAGAILGLALVATVIFSAMLRTS